VPIEFQRGGDESDVIETDRGLMAVMMSNAFRNAADATQELPSGETTVVISCGVSEEMFWITISNRFRGASFRMEDVASTGVSSKRGRGMGVAAMRIAAERLGYEIDLQASGGVAVFSVRGPRRHA
jgi:sensor histidine kinase regulating citrate/malate metabolism